MKRSIYGILMLGGAMGLSAQTLTVGSTSAAPGGAGSVNVTLSGGGGTVAGLQFDFCYDSTKLSGVLISAGASTNTAQKSVYPNSAVTPSTCTPSTLVDYRAVIIGSDASVATLQAGPNQGSGINGLADGVVATISFTLASSVALNSSTPLSLTSTVGTTAGAAGVTITPAAGSVTASNATYLVGDVDPYTANTAGSFGDGKILLADLLDVLYAETGLLVPTACSDRFDAMDSVPLDTLGVRGGDGHIFLADVIEELYRETGLDSSRPTRTSLGGTCAHESAQPNVRTTATLSARTPGLEIQGALQFGTAEPINGGEQIPVYLQARQEMVKTAVSFGISDQRSQLHFVAVPELAPSLTGDTLAGSLAVAWLNGVNLSAGQRLLLGYVVAPAGTSSNLKMFGASAYRLNEKQEVGLEVSGLSLVRQ